MGTYISIKSTVNAFRYGIDPIPEWFDKISNKTDEVDVMVEGNKVKALDIRLENGILRAFYGYYIGMYPDNSIQVFRPEDFHSLYTLKYEYSDRNRSGYRYRRIVHDPRKWRG